MATYNKVADKPKLIEAEKPPISVKITPKADYSAEIRELTLKAQEKALSIDQYLRDAEEDDEETLLMLL